mmetsp:Transcript_14576/g.13172  ORF Transcript_14576/g.13172 Transcript_14576/m.13172 type:complete len:83 (+) Transcript_14576:2109-2357(+)
MREQPSYKSDSPPPESIGDIHIDFHQFQTRVIGGYFGALIGMDRYSTMMFAMPVRSKGALHIRHACAGGGTTPAQEPTLKKY